MCVHKKTKDKLLLILNNFNENKTKELVGILLNPRTTVPFHYSISRPSYTKAFLPSATTWKGISGSEQNGGPEYQYVW